MDELSKKSTPLVRPTYEPEGGPVNPGDNATIQTNETRPGPSKPANQVSSEIFHQEDPNQSNRWITPEAKGIVITRETARFKPSQGKAASTEGQAD